MARYFLLDPETQRLRLADDAAPPAPPVDPLEQPHLTPDGNRIDPAPAPPAPAAPPAAPAQQPGLYEILQSRYGQDEADLRAAQVQDRRAAAKDRAINATQAAYHASIGSSAPAPQRTPSAVDEVTQRRALLSQHLGLAGTTQGWDRAEQKAQLEQRDAAAARDPASNRSAQARAFVKTVFGALRQRGIAVPDDSIVDQASDADLAGVLEHYGKLGNSVAGPREPQMQAPTYVQSGDGTYVAIDKKTNTAGPVIDRATGKPVSSPRPRRPLQVSHSAHLEDLKAQSDALSGMTNTFSDSFAGHGLAGGAELALAQSVGSWGSPEQQALSAWWSNFQKLIDLPQRNKLFGASLTANEKASWARAQVINPRTDPQVVRRAIAEMQGIVNGKLERYANQLVADHYEKEAIEAITGMKLLDANDPQPGQANIGTAPVAPPLGKPTAPAPQGTVWMQNPKGAWGAVPAERVAEAKASGYRE